MSDYEKLLVEMLSRLKDLAHVSNHLKKAQIVDLWQSFDLRYIAIRDAEADQAEKPVQRIACKQRG